MILNRYISKFFIVLVFIVIIQLIFFNILSLASEVSSTNNSTGNLQIYSESAILIEEKTGKVLYEKGMHDRKYPASTTKVLTAILAIENCNLSDTATASYEAVNSIKSGYTKANIQPGETFTIEELLDVLILQSANEAANVIAEHISGSVSEFANLMNQKAKEIGCTDSNFVNANGEHNENHYSSAYDLAMITKYSMQNDTFRNLITKLECKLPNTEYWTEEDIEEHGERIFKNTNNLLIKDSRYYYKYAIGGKAGFTTPAKNCLISIANKDGFETIAVVLHAETTADGLSARYIDTINLFEYGFNNYNLNEILKEYNMESDSSARSGYRTVFIDDTNSENIDSNIENQDSNNINILKIIIGIVIIVLIIFYFIIKMIVKKRKNDMRKRLYDFKVNYYGKK